MVTAAASASPRQRSGAKKFFASEKLPRELEWVYALSPLHLRLFAVDLHRALSSALIDDNDGILLREVLEDWQATAEVDATPKIAKKLKTPHSRKKYREWRPDAA